MSDPNPAVKSLVAGPRRAGLKNMALCLAMTQKLLDRGADMDRFGVFYGPSGYGKTYASIYVKNKTRGRLIEADVTWDRKTLLRAILSECGENDLQGTIAQLTQRAIFSLGDDPARPLIIDEADKLVDKGMIEIIRALHDKARVAVVLIGEESLPRKLKPIERVDNRVMFWQPAQPCDLEDCAKLAAIFLPGVGISNELLDRVREEARGKARRVVNSLTNMEEFARTHKLAELTAQNYAGEIVNGAPPRRVLPDDAFQAR